MNDLELAITASLRVDAEEASMKTDTTQQLSTLSERLDGADRALRRRRRVIAVGGIAAVAAAVVAIGVVVRTPTPPPVVGPPLTASPFSTTSFEPAFTWNPPAWTSSSLPSPLVQSADEVYWSTSESCDPACSSVLVFRPRSVKNFETTTLLDVSSPQAFVAYLRSMEKAGVITILSERQIVVDGRTGTEFRTTENRFVGPAFGCTKTDGESGCYTFSSGWMSTDVVIDDGGRTLVVGSGTQQSNPDAKTYERQFDAALATLRFRR